MHTEKMSNSIWSRIVTGDGIRRTRFHTYRDEALPLQGYVHLPRALWSTFLAQVVGYRQPRPWLGYGGVRRIKQHLTGDSRVLEFGAGMSTLYWARNVGHVVSVETDPIWAGIVAERLKAENITNVTLLVRGLDGYLAEDEFADESFDFALVDGPDRIREAELALRKVRPGGYIYLDNSDCQDHEHGTARQMLIDRGADPQVCVDLTPFHLHVSEGLLVRRP